MEFLPVVVDAFFKFLNGLSYFFFSPISELSSTLPSLLVGLDGAFGAFLEGIFTLLSKLSTGFLGDLTVFQLLLGSGVIVVLLYKLVLFLLPVAN